MYFQPTVIYRDPDETRENSIIRYIGNRVLRNNKNFLCAVVGQTGSGKSYASLAMCEIYSKMFDIPFNPNIHVISSLKEMLLLITGKETDKHIRPGSVILFDEPQAEANARNWQSEANQALNQLTSTFRNQRLVVFFATPYLEFIDKQSRILFHGEFKVLGYDKETKITNIKPRFLEYNHRMDDFYKKRLIVKYASHNKTKLNLTKLHLWHVPIASKEIIDVYEEKKLKFTTELNLKLLNKIEMGEKTIESKNKNEELLKVKALYEQYGKDYLRICAEMPHLSPFVIDKYLIFIRKSEKINAKPSVK